MKPNSNYFRLITIAASLFVVTFLSLASVANAGGFITIEPGVEMYYEDQGQGSPILFVPGWTFTTEVFQHQLNHFSKSNRVVIIDPRSHGRSTVTLEGNDYVTHAADLAKVVESLDLNDFVLVGWSFYSADFARLFFNVEIAVYHAHTARLCHADRHPTLGDGIHC